MPVHGIALTPWGWVAGLGLGGLWQEPLTALPFHLQNQCAQASCPLAFIRLFNLPLPFLQQVLLSPGFVSGSCPEMPAQDL